MYGLQGDLRPLRAVDVSQSSKRELLPDLSKPRKHDMARSRALLQRLKEIDPRTSRLLRLKDQVQNKFHMRLLKVDGTGDKDEFRGIVEPKVLKESATDGSSYIALSYCWHYANWSPNPCLTSSIASPYTEPLLPITIPMWKAFLAERESPSEAVWVDQGCIRQADPIAKINAINSMDTVFGGARKVVVALEDVGISPHDAEVLLQYCHAIQSISGRERSLVWEDWLQFVQDKEELAVTCLKIFRARWFRRAWCSHEFLTGRSHTFLVPVTSPRKQSRESVEILSFDTEFLLAVLLARTDWIVSQDRSELASVILRHENNLDGRKVDSKVAIDRFLGQNTIMVGFTRGLVETMLKRQKSESMKPYLAILGDVLSLDSSSAVDKLVITLNVLKTGLSYQGPLDLNDADVSMIATMLALAAGDASALASSGPFLRTGKYYASTNRKRASRMNTMPSKHSKAGIKGQSQIGWATKPQVDTYSRLGLERVKSPLAASVTREGLQLDLRCVASSKSIRAPKESLLQFAGSLLSWYPGTDDTHGRFSVLSADEDVVLAEFRAFSLETGEAQQVLTGADRPQLIQALACLLELGGWWAAGYGRNLRPNYLAPDADEAENQVQRLQQALVWARSLDPHLAQRTPGVNNHGSIRHHETHLVYLLRYASEIVRTGAGERSEFVKKQIDTDCAFQICKIRDATGDVPLEVETLVFAPPSNFATYELAIPAPLAAPGFPVDMNRVWILEGILDKTSSHAPIEGIVCEKYNLRGKTRFVGCTVPDGEVRRVVVGG